EREQLRRNFDAKCLRRIEVNNQLKFGRLQHRQLGGLGAFKNSAGINAKLTISICAVVSVTDESACIRELAPFIDRGNSLSCRQRNDPARRPLKYTSEATISAPICCLTSIAKTPSNSPSLLAVKMCICRPSMRAAFCTSRISKSLSGLAGFTSMPVAPF